MKLTINFKTPDVVYEALKEAQYGIEDEDKLTEIKDEVEQTVGKFVEYGECVRIEFDTVAKTATVLTV